MTFLEIENPFLRIWNAAPLDRGPPLARASSNPKEFQDLSLHVPFGRRLAQILPDKGQVKHAGLAGPALLRCSRQSRRRAIMQVKTRVKAGALAPNHNETLVRAPRQAQSLKVKTRVKAGALAPNHNETLVRA